MYLPFAALLEALAYFSITTPSSAFFVYGGYIYFDKRGRVVAMRPGWHSWPCPGLSSLVLC